MQTDSFSDSPVSVEVDKVDALEKYIFGNLSKQTFGTLQNILSVKIDSFNQLMWDAHWFMMLPNRLY